MQEVRQRRTRLSAALRSREIDAAIIASESNFLYLSGYQTHSWRNRARPLCLVVLADGSAVAVASEGEGHRLAGLGVDLEVRPYLDPELRQGGGSHELEFMGPAVREILAALADAERVGLELSSHFLPSLSPAALDAIRTKLGPGRVVDVSPFLSALRRRKSAFEVERLRLAAGVLGAAYEGFEQSARPEMTERELQRLFTAEAARAGADWVGYVVVIADAEDAPVGGPSGRRWETGRLMLVDAGIVVGGYWADFCRVYGARRLEPAQVEAYARITTALAAGRDVAAPEVRSSDVAATIAEATDGAPFGRVGHGVGLDLTESPSLHPHDPTPLEKGFVLCVEPNCHIGGVGYLMGEEEVVVTESGAELLSPPFPPEPKVLP